MLLKQYLDTLLKEGIIETADGDTEIFFPCEIRIGEDKNRILISEVFGTWQIRGGTPFYPQSEVEACFILSRIRDTRHDLPAWLEYVAKQNAPKVV